MSSLCLHEALAADAQVESCLNYRWLAHSKWSSLYFWPKFHWVLNRLENSPMQGERVLRLGIGNLDMQHPVEVEGLPLEMQQIEKGGID